MTKLRYLLSVIALFGLYVLSYHVSAELSWVVVLLIFASSLLAALILLMFEFNDLAPYRMYMTTSELDVLEKAIDMSVAFKSQIENPEEMIRDLRAIKSKYSIKSS